MGLTVDGLLGASDSFDRWFTIHEPLIVIVVVIGCCRRPCYFWSRLAGQSRIGQPMIEIDRLIVNRDFWSLPLNLKILENEFLNWNFKFLLNVVSEFTSFSLFILKFEINSDGFPQLCQRSYDIPGPSVVRLPVAGSWVVIFGCSLREGPSPPRKSVKLPLRWEPLRGCGQPNKLYTHTHTHNSYPYFVSTPCQSQAVLDQAF